jgi:hypothetical protein
MGPAGDGRRLAHRVAAEWCTDLPLRQPQNGSGGDFRVLLSTPLPITAPNLLLFLIARVWRTSTS